MVSPRALVINFVITICSTIWKIFLLFVETWKLVCRVTYCTVFCHLSVTSSVQRKVIFSVPSTIISQCIKLKLSCSNDCCRSVILALFCTQNTHCKHIPSRKMRRKWNLLYWLISYLKMTNCSQSWLILLGENFITDHEIQDYSDTTATRIWENKVHLTAIIIIEIMFSNQSLISWHQINVAKGPPVFESHE